MPPTIPPVPPSASSPPPSPPAGIRLLPNRRWSGLSRPERARLQLERDELLHGIGEIDAEIDRLTRLRLDSLQAVDRARERLWPVVPEQKGRRPPKEDEGPVPPAQPDARAVGGRSLRALCRAILRDQGPLRLRDLQMWIHHYGYRIDHPGRPSASPMPWPTRSGSDGSSAPNAPPMRSARPTPRPAGSASRSRSSSTRGWTSTSPRGPDTRASSRPEATTTDPKHRRRARPDRTNPTPTRPQPGESTPRRQTASLRGGSPAAQPRRVAPWADSTSPINLPRTSATSASVRVRSPAWSRTVNARLLDPAGTGAPR